MDLEVYTHYSPIFALVSGVSSERKDSVLVRIGSAPEGVRGFLADEATAQRIVDIVKEVGIDAKFGVAIAKLIGLRTLKDVQASEVGGLLERIGIEKVQAQNIAINIEKLLSSIPTPKEDASESNNQPVTDSARAPRPYQPLDMSRRQLPPLTQQIPEADSAPVPQRNIIDLRKPPSPST